MIALPVLPLVPSVRERGVPEPHPHSPTLLVDNYGRPLTYLRLAVTDRCNLRCFYCMPADMTFAPQKELLTFDEMLRLVRILVPLGINKVRITGGEPFMRKGLIEFLWQLRDIERLEHINITTNGVLTAPYMPALKRIGISSLNLSMDTLDRERFKQMTRRDDAESVRRTFYAALEHDVPLKINAVIMEGKNTEDIVPLAELTKNYNIEVRFIEEMPFNGGQPSAAHTDKTDRLAWNHEQIVAVLKRAFPSLQQIESDVHSTSVNYCIDGHKGTVGVIAGFSRTFCGACNRLRITAKGWLKTCLYGAGVANLRDALRAEADDETLQSMVIHAVQRRFRDGYEAEREALQAAGVLESMSLIGG